MKTIPGSMSAVLAAAVAACGSTTNPVTPGGGCTITLSGAINATTSPCTPVGAYGASSNTLGFAISNQGTSTSFKSFGFSMKLPGTSLTTGTFTSANSTSAGTVVTGNTSTQIWLQSYNSGGANQGTFSLTITSTGTEIDSGADKAWPNAHGSLTATLAPSGSATGTLSASVTF